MLIARVSGTVVSTHKEKSTENIKFLLVDVLNGQTLKSTGTSLVAMDAAGAGHGEIVMVVQGSSARMTETTEGKPADATIIAVLEQIESNGKLVYNKADDE